MTTVSLVTTRGRGEREGAPCQQHHKTLPMPGESIWNAENIEKARSGFVCFVVLHVILR